MGVTHQWIIAAHSACHVRSPHAAGSEPGSYHTWYFTGQPGDISPLAPTGGQAPGMPEGVVFTHVFDHNMAINSRGEVVFFAAFAGPSETGAALWFRDVAGELSMLIAAGDQIETPAGSLATIAGFEPPSPAPFFGTDDSGLPTLLSESGRMLVVARLDDGSRALLTIAIPAPAGGFTIVLGLTVLSRRRRGSPSRGLEPR